MVPKLTPAHKKARVKFAKDNHNLGSDWDQVIFSDEKKFSLDGPDGWRYYVSDERKSLPKRQGGGGGVMVWAGFSAVGKTEIAFLNGRQNSECYIKTRHEYLLPFIAANHDEGYIYQQDNASIYTSKRTKDWMDGVNLALMDWPALSPDSNPMENLWAMMVREIYKDFKVYDNVSELKLAIKAAWDKLSSEALKKLVDSMPTRCFLVAMKNGSTIRY